MTQLKICHRCIEAADEPGLICRIHRTRTPLTGILENADTQELSGLLRENFGPDKMDQIRFAVSERMANPPERTEPEPKQRSLADRLVLRELGNGIFEIEELES